MAMASLSPMREDRAFMARSALAPELRALYRSSRNTEEENQTICPSLPHWMDTARAKGPSVSPSSFS